MTTKIKSAVVAAALAVESFLLTNLLFEYVIAQDYFAVNLGGFLVISALFLLLLWTYSLSVGGWGRWEQYVFVALPMGLGVFVSLLQFDLVAAGLIGAVSLFLIAFYTTSANDFKKEMVHFRPDIILNNSARGIVFTFSLITAALVFIYSTEVKEINVGEKVGEYAQQNSSKLFDAPLPPGINIGILAEAQFNQAIAPYKDYIAPILALLVFTVIRFVGGIAGFAFEATVRPLFWLFKRIGFLHSNHTSVEKEEIGFESAKS
jgi:hypothetical protein